MGPLFLFLIGIKRSKLSRYFHEIKIFSDSLNLDCYSILIKVLLFKHGTLVLGCNWSYSTPARSDKINTAL